MIELFTVIAILFAHFFADFQFQSDYMARKKSSSWGWLTTHVACYIAVLGAVLLMILPEVIKLNWSGFFLYLLINALAHWATDAISSRSAKYFYEQGDRHNFFVAIGFDQLLHTVTLITTWTWIFN